MNGIQIKQIDSYFRYLINILNIFYLIPTRRFGTNNQTSVSSCQFKKGSIAGNTAYTSQVLVRDNCKSIYIQTSKQVTTIQYICPTGSQSYL